MGLLRDRDIALVTFDMDGTLYDIEQGRWRRSWLGLRHPRLIQVWPQSLESLRGLRDPQLVQIHARRLARSLGRDPRSVELALDTLLRVSWPRCLHPSMVRPGLRALLQRLDQEGLRRALISDYPCEKKAQALELGGWVEAVDCRSLGALKPLPDALLLLAERHQLPPERILHVGDREDTDGLMAAQAGVESLILGRDWEAVSGLEQVLFGGS